MQDGPVPDPTDDAPATVAGGWGVDPAANCLFALGVLVDANAAQSESMPRSLSDKPSVQLLTCMSSSCPGVSL